MGFRELLATEWAPYGTLSDDQMVALERHYELLMRWNQRMNLTRIEKLEDVVKLHYCESLFLGSKLPAGTLRIADIGSGAGFPGFPVAVLRPDCRVDLVESNQRKSVFLREACAGSENIRVVPDRAEDLKDRYDWLISRAVLPSEVVALKLAPRVALLMAESDLKGFKSPEGLSKVPWGIGHIAVEFHVEHST